MASERLSIPLHIVSRVLSHPGEGSGAAAVTQAHYIVHAYVREKRAALDAWARLLREIVDDAPLPSNVIRLRAFDKLPVSASGRIIGALTGTPSRCGPPTVAAFLCPPLRADCAPADKPRCRGTQPMPPALSSRSPSATDKRKSSRITIENPSFLSDHDESSTNVRRITATANLKECAVVQS